MAAYKDGDSRTINGITYVRQNGQWLPQGGSPAIGPAIGNNPLIPGQLAAQGPNIQGQQLQNVRTQQQIASQPLQNENTAVNIAQGKKSLENTDFGNANTLRTTFNALPEVKNYSEALAALGGALRAPDSPQGDLAIVYAFAKAMDPGSVVREGEMDMANQTASIVQRLQQQYGLINGGKRLPPAVRTGLLEAARQKVAGMRPLYDQQYSRFADLAKKNGFAPQDVVGEPLYKAVRPAEEGYIREHGGTPKIDGVPVGLGDKTRNDFDPVVTAQLDALIRAGVPYDSAVKALPKEFTPPDRSIYNQAVQFAKRNPDYKNSLAEATRTVPTTSFQRFAGSPAGAFISGAGKAATLGLGDEAAGAINSALTGEDYTQARDEFAVKQGSLAAANPTADLLGQMAGGAVTGIGLNAAASKIPGASGALFGARTPFPSLLNRGAVASDVAFGAGYGAGSENNDRLSGAMTGAGLGLGGGIAARGAINGVASAISPTGGKMRPLYDMGVRPSIGQRMGGIVNNLEEKIQSLPVIGDAIKGTRDRARDQFQIGLFNDSLGEIGQALPKGMAVGHEPHAFAQEAFNRAYDTAKSGMTAVTDGPFSQDIGNLQQTVGNLRPESQQQFAKAWTGSVARRLRDGALSGPAFKDATSELEKKIAAIRNSKTGDGELADALQQATDALKGSAMRNSPPEAVAAMDAADRGYAKLVRIEEASRKAGGEPAEFSPSQYNTAVKTASGGTRNRQYLRGDALNADIAALGTRLGDKVSNSGTVDRYAPLAIASGMGYVEPMSAMALGGYGALNAPGVRNVVTEAMAPRANPLFDRAADQLRRRARLAGMFGAPAALDYYGQ